LEVQNGIGNFMTMTTNAKSLASFVSGFRSSHRNMQGQTAKQTLQVEPGDQQGAAVKGWRRKPLQVSIHIFLLKLFNVDARCYSNLSAQSA
jgi:hypothetical protein